MTNQLLKKAIVLLCLQIIVSSFALAQTSFTSKDIRVNIFSSTPLADIEAQATNGVSTIVPKTKQVVFQIPVKDLIFVKSLMQEHFNKSYMESEKYPTATFKGNIKEDVDFKKDGVYNINVMGALNMHGINGITKNRTIKGVITIKDGKLSINSSFDVPCADHKIKIPTLLFTKMGEVISVTVSGSYQ